MKHLIIIIAVLSVIPVQYATGNLLVTSIYALLIGITAGYTSVWWEEHHPED